MHTKQQTIHTISYQTVQQEDYTTSGAQVSAC
jgi:hypothetical protein